jgi:hypothetical protein
MYLLYMKGATSRFFQSCILSLSFIPHSSSVTAIQLRSIKQYHQSRYFIMARTRQTARKTTGGKVAGALALMPVLNVGKKKSTTKKSAIESEPEPLPTTLPELPVAPAEFLNYLAANKDVPIRKLMEPFLEYETVIRQYLAQAPDHEWVKDNTVNLLSVFDEGNAKELTVRARNLELESEEEKKK